MAMPNDDMIPLDMDYQVLRRIGPICDAFEAELRRDANPVIEDYTTKGIESDRSALLLELLKLADIDDVESDLSPRSVAYRLSHAGSRRRNVFPSSDGGARHHRVHAFLYRFVGP